MIHKYQYKYKTNLWFPFLLCLGFLLHTAEFYFSLWLLPQLLHWELTAGAVTGPWAALFAQGKAGYTQSSFGSIGLRSSIGNVRWLLGRCSAYSLMPFLLQRCVKTEPKAAPWLLFGLVCGRTQPRPFPPVLSFPVHCTGVAGWAGNRSERIALQGGCPRFCVVLCRVCPWLPGAPSTTAVQEKEKTLQRMKRKML